MAEELTDFDPADFITNSADQLDLLQDALESGNAKYIANAIGIVARARNKTELAENAGLTRAGFYKAFGKDGNPRLSTLLSVINALGLKLSFEVLEPQSSH